MSADSVDDTLVCTAAFYPAGCVADKTKLLQESCDYYGIELAKFGVDRVFSSFVQAKVFGLRDFLRSQAGKWKTVVYLDATDTLFVRPLDALLEAYATFDSPLVFAAEEICWPHHGLADRFPLSLSPYRYLQAGTFMGSYDYLLGCLSRLTDYVTKLKGGSPITGDWVEALASHATLYNEDQGLWQHHFVEKKLALDLDYNCELFQAGHGKAGGFPGLEWVDGRLKNERTGSYPCVLHFCGNALRGAPLVASLLRGLRKG